MRRALVRWLTLALLSLSPQAVMAHGSGMTALVNVKPELPVPGGRAQITIDLLDVYRADVTTARVRASLRSGAEAQLSTLMEEVAGSYKGELAVPEAGTAVLYVEANYLGELYWGEVAVRIGPGGTKLWQLPVELLHEDAYTGGEPAAPVEAPTAQPSGPLEQASAQAGAQAEAPVGPPAGQVEAPAAQPSGPVGGAEVPAGDPVTGQGAPAPQPPEATGPAGDVAPKAALQSGAATGLWLLGLLALAALLRWLLRRSSVQNYPTKAGDAGNFGPKGS